MFRNEAAQCLQLRQGGEGRLVGEVVLACLDYAGADCCPLVRDGGRGDELQAVVFQQVREAGDGLGLGIARLIGAKALRAWIVNVRQRCPGFDQAIGLAVDVAVVQVGRGKLELTRCDHGRRLPLGRIGCALADAHSHPKPTSVLYRALATTVRMHSTMALL